MRTHRRRWVVSCHRSRAERRPRFVEIIRGLWGVILLAGAGRVLGSVNGLRVDRRSRVVARILGGRHLVQALLSGCRPSAEVLALGVWVDGVHACVATALAVIDRSRLRAGGVDAVVATLWSMGGLHDLRRAGVTPSPDRTVRDKLAMLALRWVPGGRRVVQQVGTAAMSDVAMHTRDRLPGTAR